MNDTISIWRAPWVWGDLYLQRKLFRQQKQFDKLMSQQLMIRDGGFKIGTDLLFDKANKTDNWLVKAVNLRPPFLNQ